MKGRSLFLVVSFLMLPTGLNGVDSRAVREVFAHPPREYATAPLWVWNDRLTVDQIRGTLRDLAGQAVRQAFVHPRPGLMTPYLSEEWFALWRAALDEAARLDMNIWIYDENSYPSGFAGGWVPELMPEARGRGLHFRESAEAPAWTTNTLAVFRLAGGEAEDVSGKVRTGDALPAGRHLAAVVERAGNSPWHGGRCYVDLLHPGVTAKFLEVTLGAYEREIGAHFGKRVPGVFTDEPNITPAGGLPWTEDFAVQFQARRGYGLLPNLASLNREAGDWRRVRHDFFRTALELFIERWGKPFYERCDRLGLEFTGHYWEHEWPHCVGVPDNMAMAAWQHRPGIDTLMNQYSEDTHAQFGNIRAPKEVLSLANQLGRKRTLVELYGAGGWDLRFEDMKRIADWLLVLGINTLDEHLSYVTLRGARKRDHPQSFSAHEPWWDSYGVLARYMTRLSAAMSQGQQVNRILLLEPTTTAWMYQGKEDRLGALGGAFAELVKAFEMAQVEYDLGCEDVLARHGSVNAPSLTAPTSRATLRVAQRAYDVVVLPPGTENLEAMTATLLDQFLQAGGSVVACDAPPARVDGGESSQGRALARCKNWVTVAAQDLPATLRNWADPARFEIQRPAGDPGILFHHRRELTDGELLLLVNTSIQHASTGTVVSTAGGVERWDAFTGKTEPWVFEKRAHGVKASFELPPCGSLLLFLPKKALKPPKPARTEMEMVSTLPGPTTVERLEPNVLTLDYVDIAVGGESRSNVYFYAANQLAWQKHGLPRNPWDSAVQFKDELITRTFPADSGFVATYRFRVEGGVPDDLEIVVERPDLYTITCNGQPVGPTPGAWWLDRAFGRIALAGVACPGENVVRLTASPFTMHHEIEPAYVRGSFTLEGTEQGFLIRPDAPLSLGQIREPGHDVDPDATLGARGLSQRHAGWNEQGHPFYGGGVAYRQTYRTERKQGRYFVRLSNWNGSMAKVGVNGRFAGHIVSAPWECEVTEALRRGDNQIEVVVVGTLKNTLGPHHGPRARGSAWPGMFQQGPAPGPPPGDRYDTIAYGLFEPIAVRQLVRR